MSETQTFAQLAEWSRGRWACGQHDASNSIMERAVAQAAIEHEGKKVVRDTRTGALNLVDEKPKTQEELDNEELERMEKEEEEREKAKAKQRKQK